MGPPDDGEPLPGAVVTGEKLCVYTPGFLKHSLLLSINSQHLNTTMPTLLQLGAPSTMNNPGMSDSCSVCWNLRGWDVAFCSGFVLDGRGNRLPPLSLYLLRRSLTKLCPKAFRVFSSGSFLFLSRLNPACSSAFLTSTKWVDWCCWTVPDKKILEIQIKSWRDGLKDGTLNWRGFN